MRILITGANGYIGKSLYNALKDKHDVTALTRQDFDLTKANPTEHFFGNTQFFDVVLHCAVAGGSRLKKDDWSVMDENLSMYYNLFANKNYFGKLIHFGSGAEIYDLTNPYGYSKSVIRKSILNQPGFFSLRIFGVFDENELDTRFIKANIKHYINKEPIQIHQDKMMDLFYMPDLVKVVEYYISKEDAPKEIDCCYGDKDNSAWLLSDVAGIINKLGKHKVRINNPNKDRFVVPYTGDAIELDLDFIGLEQGIRNVYNKLNNEAN